MRQVQLGEPRVSVRPRRCREGNGVALGRPRCTGEASSTSPPLRVVITGATKGLGLELARQFVADGHRVMICSRRAAAVETTVQELRVGQDAGEPRAHGVACDVSRPGDVDALVDAVRAALGGCDLWVNNAGSNAYRYAPLVETSPEAIIEVVSCNLTGTLLCCRAAMRLMMGQAGGGHLFNMLGAGSDQGATDQYAVYGATKAALPQLAKSLQLEVGDAPVGVHNISPGLVWTELIQAGRNTFGAQGRWFINALCEPADDVARAMVPLLLQVAQQPRRPGQGGQTLRVLPPQLAAQRLLARVLTGKNKGRWYPED